MFAKLLVLMCEEKVPSGDETAREYYCKRRKNAADSSRVERNERELSKCKVSKDDSRYQVARDYKEDIHADKSGWYVRRKGMEEHYRDNGDSAESIDIWTECKV